MRSGGAGHASLCVALKQEQLGENELRYVAWDARFCDNISALRDGMRCAESKLTIVSCLPGFDLSAAQGHAHLPGESRDPDSVRKTSHLTFVCVPTNVPTFSPSMEVPFREFTRRWSLRHPSEAPSGFMLTLFVGCFGCEHFGSSKIQLAGSAVSKLFTVPFCARCV